MSIKYSVQITHFAEKHHLKRLQKKKYKRAFNIPWYYFLVMLQKFDLLLEKKRMKTISGTENDIVICKTEFKILPRESAKSSGNRCIVAWHKSDKEVRVLLVYDKSDIKGPHESVWWKKIIKENYTEYQDLL